MRNDAQAGGGRCYKAAVEAPSCAPVQTHHTNYGRLRHVIPHSAFRNPHSAVSLIEVLVSVGVLALGLLGVAALFPVGGHYLRQGEVSDRADAIAESALSDAIARGMLDPENWLAARPARDDGPRTSLFDRQFAATLRNFLRDPTGNNRAGRLTSADPVIRSDAIREVNLFAGSVFVIDPLGVAEGMNPEMPQLRLGFMAGPVGFFPASTNPQATFFNNIAPPSPANPAGGGWYPWLSPPSTSQQHPDRFGNQSPVPLIESWPVRRMSVSTGGPPITGRPTAPSVAQAESMVLADDDLAIELNDYNGNPFRHTDDSPSQQRWEPSTAGPEGRAAVRQARSEFSWLLTVVPTTPEARDGLATNPESFSYDVSAVVMYKRVTGGRFEGPASANFFGHEAMMLGERQLRASVGATGIGGGQIRVFNDAGGELDAPRDRESPLENLRAGQWVMLFGPHPDSTSTRPLLFCQWYEVVSLEEDPQADASLFVSGPDWPWTPLPTANQTAADAGIQNDLRLVIVPDVVAVHTRTLKLEPGAAWGID